MRTDYTQKGLNKQIKKVRDYLEDNTSLVHENFPEYKSIIKREGSSKWIFNTNTINGIMDIKLAISKVTDKKYRELFEIALASLFLEVSNVYRDGKSLKYKKKKNDFQRIEIHEKFYSKISNVIYVDIKKINQYKRDEGKLFSNYSFCYLGDCKKTIEKLDDDSIDLIITSPPYLNSRDYTDSYMIELWMLDLIKDYGQLKKLRGNTLKSHVQFSWESSPTLDIYELTSALNQLEEHREQFWNKNLPNMIKGYFCDMDVLFYQFSKKVMKNGMVYFNVANSAYYGIEIKVDKIISRIAEIHGFQVCEIRRARKISPSSQQKGKIPFLTEVVIVMRKK